MKHTGAPGEGEPAPPKAVTLHAVAAAAGVSTATVSKALNGLPVSAQSMQRVLDAARELGYVPNLAARAMRNEKTQTLGLVVNFEGHPRSELLGVFQTLIGRMESEGLSVLMSIVRNVEVDLDALLQRFISHRVDGLFYWYAWPSPVLALYARAGIPVLAVGYRHPGCAELPLVTMDGAPAFALACERLVQLGHRRFAEIVIDRAAPIHEFYRSHPGVTWSVYRVGHRGEELRAALDTALGNAESPTVLFASPPTVTQLLAVAEAMRLRIPEDLSLISLADIEDATLLRTPLSAFRTDFAKMGTAAAEAMLAALAGQDVGDSIVGDSAIYIERASTGPAPSGRVTPPARGQQP